MAHGAVTLNIEYVAGAIYKLSSVALWLGRRTCESVVIGRAFDPDRLVLESVTVVGRSYNLGMYNQQLRPT